MARSLGSAYMLGSTGSFLGNKEEQPSLSWVLTAEQNFKAELEKKALCPQ